MLDDLRRSTTADDFEFEEEDDSTFVVEDDREEKVQKLFLGMTAVERMFLSIFLFLNVGVLGLAFLLATGRIVF